MPPGVPGSQACGPLCAAAGLTARFGSSSASEEPVSGGRGGRRKGQDRAGSLGPENSSPSRAKESERSVIQPQLRESRRYAKVGKKQTKRKEVCFISSSDFGDGGAESL